jgi:hypothetical protein
MREEWVPPNSSFSDAFFQLRSISEAGFSILPGLHGNNGKPPHKN